MSGASVENRGFSKRSEATSLAPACFHLPLIRLNFESRAKISSPFLRSSVPTIYGYTGFMMKMVAGAGIAGVLLIGGYMLLNSTENSITGSVVVPYFENSVAGQTSFACKSLVSANAYADSIEKMVEGTTSIGTDDVALLIKDENTLVMTTAASIKIGVAEGDEMRILENDVNKLTAVWYGSDVNGVISSIALNKTNGLAVWSKANTDFALLGVPMGSVIYMTCI